MSTLTQIPTALGRVDAYVGFGILGVFYLCYWLITYINVRMEIRGLPAIHSWMELFEAGTRSRIPHIPFIFPVAKLTLQDPFAKYQRAGSDLIACSQVTTSYPVYVTASPQVAAAVMAKTSVFHKPTAMFRYQAINIFGLQIVSAQTGEEHRRHKGVVKGCFNEAVMQNAWDEMVKAFEVMCREGQFEGGGTWKNVKESMIKATLLVIGATAFNIQVPWNIPHTDGPLLPMAEALELVELSMIPQLLLPLWFMKYSPFAYLRRCAKAQISMITHIHDMVKTRRTALTHEQGHLAPGEKVKPPSDILGALVASQMNAEEEARLEKGTGGKIIGLTDREILGNTFIFIVAGHETTGHTLTFVLAYLALYPNWQQKVYDEITEVCGDALPTYRDISRLPLCLAVCYESLRLRDLVMTLPRLVVEDTVVPYKTWDTEGNITDRTRLIKKGSHFCVDSPASQVNPQHWPKPKDFDPTRHLTDKGAQTSPTYTGFSLGVRQCIGRRFAEVEMIAMVSHVVKTFKLGPVQAFEGETWEEMKERYERATEELSFTPSAFDIRCERR